MLESQKSRLFGKFLRCHSVLDDSDYMISTVMMLSVAEKRVSNLSQSMVGTVMYTIFKRKVRKLISARYVCRGVIQSSHILHSSSK